MQWSPPCLPWKTQARGCAGLTIWVLEGQETSAWSGEVCVLGHLRKAKCPTCHKAPFAGLVDGIESKPYDVSPSSKDWSRTFIGPDSSMAFGVSVLLLRPQVYHSSPVSSEPLSTSVKRKWCLVWRVAGIPWEGAKFTHGSRFAVAHLACLHCGSHSAAVVPSLWALWPSCCPFWPTQRHEHMSLLLSGLGGLDSNGVWFHLLTVVLFPWGHDLSSLLMRLRLVRCCTPLQYSCLENPMGGGSW